MPAYKVYIDGIDTGDTVVAENFTDAYIDAASTRPLTYENEVQLREIESSEDRL